MTRNPWRTFTMTAHATQVMRDKGFDPATVARTLKAPSEVYPSGMYPGQWRITGNGLCIVGKPEGDAFIIITMYLDRVITPLRPDQQAAGIVINRSR
jgi:hypothetical protein